MTPVMERISFPQFVFDDFVKRDALSELPRFLAKVEPYLDKDFLALRNRKVDEQRPPPQQQRAKL